MSNQYSDGLTFWEHLEQLRVILIRAAVVFGVCMVAAFMAMPYIFDRIILWPCDGSFPLYRLMDSGISSGWLSDLSASSDFHVSLVSMELTSQFFIHFSAACWGGVLVAFPFLIYLFWGFISPGLYPREKQGARRAFFWGNLMFFTGVAVGYMVVFPIALRFLAEYRISQAVTPMISLDSYMDNFFTLIILMGALFELPLVAWMLGRAGILKRSFFKRYRRYAIFGIAVIAAGVTPTGDPFSMAAVFLPVYALWEMSAHLVPKNEPAHDSSETETP
ncbi:MAG: twin-arginine translocase subunit TatC [Muribaculaceae bacterium]|nr:twin-arginine translocase subunit TatC [Muribaculaceae bacterium]